MATCDVVVLGAGPYGLAATAHLRGVKGLEVRTFGEPMDFWKSHMPEGMFLRSPWAASHISDPQTSLTMDAFRDSGQQIPVPIPLDKFVEYGLWFQGQAAPNVERQKIVRVERNGTDFRLFVDTGEEFHSRRVVIAAGIGSFAQRLSQFAGLPPESVGHASDQRDVKRFSGKNIAVIGAGQSALESAALLHEAGAHVEVIARTPAVHWLGWRARIQKLGPVAKLLYSPFDIGPAGISRIVALPDMVKYFPRSIQNRFRKRALRPAGARWLIDRCAPITITTSTSIVSALSSNNRIRLTLTDSSSREVDHVLLGTGYRVDINKYPFLAPELSQSVSQQSGFPLLSHGFESSVPGLHFIGAPSAWRFGPLMFFVCGTDFAARRLAQHFIQEGSK